MLEQGGIYPVGAADVHDAGPPLPEAVVALLAARLDERREDALAVLWDAVVEFLKGPEILSRVFEAIDEVEVGLAEFLVRNTAVMLDLDTPNVNGCAEACGAARRPDADVAGFPGRTGARWSRDKRLRDRDRRL